MNEYEEVRLQVKARFDIAWADAVTQKVPYTRELSEDTDAILSIKGIEIRADDQSLPESAIQYSDSIEDQILKAQYNVAQKDMLKAGFVKVIPREKI